MTKSRNHRLVSFALAGIVLGGTTLALAAPGGANGAKRNCAGEHKGGAARFQKADKNNDGFLTKDEMGEGRWERIKVADANNDGKISKDEMKQAHESGKLGHRRHGKKPAA